MLPPLMKISHLLFLLLSQRSKLSTHYLYIPNKSVHPFFHYRLNYTILVVSPFLLVHLSTHFFHHFISFKNLFLINSQTFDGNSY